VKPGALIIESEHSNRENSKKTMKEKLKRKKDIQERGRKKLDTKYGVGQGKDLRRRLFLRSEIRVGGGNLR